MEPAELDGPDEDIASDLVTVFAGALHQPIADLIWKLAEYKRRSSATTVGQFENGYCASIVILTVLAFESYVSRIAFLRQRQHGETRDAAPKETSSYLRHLDPKFPLAEELRDVYVVRDALAHGHLWTVDFVIKKEGGTEVIKRELLKGFGNDALRKRRVNLLTGMTHLLGLNVLPTSIGAQDAANFFRVVAMSLDHLIKSGHIEQPAVVATVRYGGKFAKFWNLHAELVDSIAAAPSARNQGV